MNSILDRVRARAENGVYTGYAKNDVIALLAQLGLLTCAAREVLSSGATDSLRSALEHIDAPARDAI